MFTPTMYSRRRTKDDQYYKNEVRIPAIDLPALAAALASRRRIIIIVIIIIVIVVITYYQYYYIMITIIIIDNITMLSMDRVSAQQQQVCLQSGPTPSREQ